MANHPPDDKQPTVSSSAEPSTPASRSPFERSRFGGSQRKPNRASDDAPVSRSDLSKGLAELVEQPKAQVNWAILLISSSIILAFSLWTMLMPEGARVAMKIMVDWIGANLGWYYVLTMALIIGFVVWVALSKEGGVRLGPDHSRPQYKLGTWVAMLFAAGVGIDLLFFSVTGPVVNYLQPPTGEGASAGALQDAVVWTMFHYGIAGWSVYALLGMAMGYFAYRWDMPLSIRAALYPLLGKRARGPLGDGISIVALVGTVFGVATTMGIGVVLLNVGFARIFGLEQGLILQIALVGGAVVLTIVATTSGVDRGIRWISELNLWSAVAMMIYILVAGQTAFLLGALVENIGQFLVTLPSRMLRTLVYEPNSSQWMSGWTLFFWAFWLAWGPFVGVFLARISRGRTLREFVIAAITVPVLCDFIIVSFFGNSALFEVLAGNNEFAQLAATNPEQGWYALLDTFPGAMVLICLATFSGLLFYLTSANSGAMVMSNFSATIPNPAEDGPKWLRIFWALLTAMLTIAMLLAGGVVTMEYATLIFALPVTIIAYLVMASFHKALRMERAEREGLVLRRASQAPSGGHLPARSWKQRLAQMLAYPTLREVSQFLERTVRPALDDIAVEFRREGYEVERANVANATGIEGPLIRVTLDELRAFHYQVSIVETPVPTFSGKMSIDTDVYYRLEVFTQTGSGGYDLMGLTKQQVIDDVLERYEAHLAFLALSAQTDTPSVLTPPVASSD
ncbi:choline BCCT transporter BetT [Oceanisphaera avium]|uniref:High-affinity choline transporter BetT n=1 Tax=Oceanisphaera avium TaxID=1903694 RepID=A0A1Y0CVR0_9GAMM|nr:choline BCCT transporter BetT [Oceanisphaera avium]ART79411.1 high-affinity choline transporter BetT [Oceanisphaera avium]